MITFQQDSEGLKVLEDDVVVITGDAATYYFTGYQTLQLQMSRYKRGSILKRAIPKTILNKEIQQWQPM